LKEKREEEEEKRRRRLYPMSKEVINNIYLSQKKHK